MVKDKWSLSNCKILTVLYEDARIAFQRVGLYTRGLTISRDAFEKMEDVTIIPGMQLELESNTWLLNHGNRIHMVKYCLTRDNKKCDGGFFSFTPKEWMYFWNTIRLEIIKAFEM